MALVALIHAGHVIIEFKNEQGEVVKRVPLSNTTINEQEGLIQIKMPMTFAKSLMAFDFELQANCMRTSGAIDDSMDVLVLTCKKKDPKAIITDFQLRPDQVQNIKSEALRWKRKLN